MLGFFRMGRILKSFLFSLIALFGAAQIIGGFSFNNDLTTLVVAAIVFGIVNSFLKPILKLITLPFTILTLGLFSSVINVVLLYLTIQVVPGLSINAFTFPGLSFDSLPGLTIPAFNVPILGTLLLTSAVISIFMVLVGIIFDRR